jgi:hypothetical protein
MNTPELSASKLCRLDGLIGKARLLIATVLLSLTGLSLAATERPFHMGFTPWPWDTDWAAVKGTYDFINENADIVSHHIEEGVPWSEAISGAPFHPKMVEAWTLRRNLTDRKLKVFLSISPIDQLRTGLAQYRGADPQMPLPPEFGKARFNDPKVKKAYLAYARKAIEFFNPDYLAIAIEANELLDNAPHLWADFVELYIETYGALKKDHPQLPIFFTASVHNVMNPERGVPAVTWARLENLWQHADIVAASYYPFLQRPLDLTNPLNALDELARRAAGKPIAISEAGYPAKQPDIEALRDLPASPEIQNSIYYGLLHRATAERYAFVILWAHRDYDALWNRLKGTLPEWGALWRDVGILDGSGRQRPSGGVWQLYLEMKGP